MTRTAGVALPGLVPAGHVEQPGRAGAEPVDCRAVVEVARDRLHAEVAQRGVAKPVMAQRMWRSQPGVA